jgi:hypothetical protein
MEKTKTHKKDEGIEFVKYCIEYCKLLEKADKLPLHELLDRISSSLMAIYEKTFAIPRFQTKYESEIQKYLTEKQYNVIRLNIMGLLDKKDEYAEILDPNRPANQNIFQASLSEDLTDIYQDLYDFVKWHSIGTFESVNDSLIECLNNFEKYWGVKLLNALRAVHVIRYLKKDGTIFRDPLNDEDDELPVALEPEEDMEADALDEFLKEEL